MPLQRLRPEDKTEVWRPRKSVRLYLDDVDEILAVLKHTDHSVAAVTPDFAGGIETAEELKTTGQRTLTDLVLAAGSKDHNVSVELKTPVTVRIVPKDALDLAGASQRVQDVLSSRQERLGGWHLGSDSEWFRIVASLMIAGFTLAGTAIATTTSTAGDQPEGDIDWAISGWLLGAAGLVLLLLLSLVIGRKATGPNRNPRATVVLAYRLDAPTWWERNRTTVLIGLVTNVGTGLLFFLLGLWLGGG